MKAIWIVDDDQSIRWVLEKALTRNGMVCKSFTNARDALAEIDSAPPQVLVSDIRMPGMNGLELLQNIKRLHPDLPVIVMTAFSDLDSAVSAFQGGAFEYLAKPFDVNKAVELIRSAAAESMRVADAPDAPSPAPEILGHAPAMQDVFRAIGRLSQSNVTVLITGESGSGKELVARALHKHSPRAQSPFIALNTAAIPKDLLESELFGHERGAFTGAQTLRRGRFEQAESGTLFLDEIGDMPAELQTRLLRVLSDGHFYRVGGQSPIKANVRVIAATHQDLEQRVKEGLFREDLYHRLNVIRLRLPSLRERKEDVELLTRHFLASSAKELGGEPKRLTPAALAAMAAYDFPGNVRQLENVCRWITVMAPAQTVDVSDLPPEVLEGPKAVPAAGGSSSTAVVASATGSSPSTVHAAPVLPAPVPKPEVAYVAIEPVHAAQDSGAVATNSQWQELLRAQVLQRLAGQGDNIMDDLTRDFETVVIGTALQVLRGRRIEAAQRLGLGRNTITRKIADLHLEEPKQS